MSSGERAENVYRALLKELGVSVSEEQGDGVLSFKSEECKFTLSVHRGEDGKFDKAVLEKPAEGKEACKKFSDAVDALAELLKAFSDSCKKSEEMSEEKPEDKGEEEKKDDAGEAKEEAKEEETEETKAEEKPAEPAADA